MTFTETGYPLIDTLLEEVSKYTEVLIEYPLADFTVGGTLFRIFTEDKELALKIYPQYQKEIPVIEKEIDRLNKMLDGLNNKFCNEKWLQNCPEEVILKEYKKLCDTEKKIEAKTEELINKKYIVPNITLKQNETN